MQSSLYSIEEELSLQGSSTSQQRNALEWKYAPLLKEELHLASLVSYTGNKRVPILRLYRYKEAFSFAFVKDCLVNLGLPVQGCVLDPFCGMGTTLFTSGLLGVPSIGVDRLPIATFVAQTLPQFLKVEPEQVRESFWKLKEQVDTVLPAPVASDVAIMKVAFPEENLIRLRQWKQVIEMADADIKPIFQLLLLSVLEACSYTSKDGQFLRLNRHKQVSTPDEALWAKVLEAERDIRNAHKLGWHLGFCPPQVLLGDARNLPIEVRKASPTILITSPPYANRYDYTRTYSLELCFYFVRSFEELKALRFGVLRSHIESKVHEYEEAPHPAVQEVVQILKKHKALNNPRIPDMLTAYFVDMESVIHAWAQLLQPKATVVMVVDNVRFEGEMVPVDLILSDIAERYGFQVEAIRVARYKGNSSQQMGKYGRMPVRESILVWTKR